MAILIPFGLIACSNDAKPILEQELVSAKGDDIVKGINVKLSDFTAANADTRTAYTDIVDGVKVTWTAGDTIGIFPNEGGQVEFPIQAGTESNQATFDGGGWALRSNSTYAAYYPFCKWNVFRDNETILLDYTGQTQAANGSSEHLAKYDYQATGGVQTNSSGYLNFQFKHLGALMVFNLTVPKAGTYTSLTLTSPEKVFVTKVELDISGAEPELKPTGTSNSITLQLDNIELVSDNSELTAYMILAPTDLAEGSLELSLNGSSNYSHNLTGHQLEAGKQYVIEKVLDNTPSPDEVIAFADETVKAICVRNWDTNGDGELSYAEASEVKNIDFDFSKQSIKSFKEFRYFTGVTSIGSSAFHGCSSLASIMLPEGVTTIGSYAFYDCSSLTSIVLPEGVTTIDSYAFENCYSLTGIVLPESLTSIGYGAFHNCSSLTSIVIPESVTSISAGAFQNCSSLTSFNVPEGITIINFLDSCTGLTSITIPEGVTSVTLSGCSSLESIKLPKGITSFGYCAFYGCSSLTSIEIPEGVTTIGERAFEYCSNLTSLVIPEGVTTIGERAFYGCSSLTSFTCLATNPPSLGKNAFNLMTGSIYVPAASLNAYKKASGWSNYASQIQTIPE